MIILKISSKNLNKLVKEVAKSANVWRLSENIDSFILAEKGVNFLKGLMN